MGQLVFGIAGAAIGGAIGGPTGAQLGFALGSAIGAATQMNDSVQQDGPHISDLSVQGSQYGAVIPLVFGTDRMTGQVIWSTNLVESKNTSVAGDDGKGGTGGASSTTYIYSCSFAVLVCAGPISYIPKIWADGKLIYDSSTYTGTFNNAPLTIRIYKGTDTQPTDPFMEAVDGVGNVPAYRYRAYVFFENLDLSPFGNRIPQFTFEVVRNGALRTSRHTSFADVPNTALTVPSNTAPQSTGYGYEAVSEVTPNKYLMHCSFGVPGVDPAGYPFHDPRAGYRWEWYTTSGQAVWASGEVSWPGLVANVSPNVVPIHGVPSHSGQNFLRYNPVNNSVLMAIFRWPAQHKAMLVEAGAPTQIPAQIGSDTDVTKDYSREATHVFFSRCTSAVAFPDSDQSLVLITGDSDGLSNTVAVFSLQSLATPIFQYTLPNSQSYVAIIPAALSLDPTVYPSTLDYGTSNMASFLAIYQDLNGNYVIQKFAKSDASPTWSNTMNFTLASKAATTGVDIGYGRAFYEEQSGNFWILCNRGSANAFHFIKIQAHPDSTNLIHLDVFLPAGWTFPSRFMERASWLTQESRRLWVMADTLINGVAEANRVISINLSLNGGQGQIDATGELDAIGVFSGTNLIPEYLRDTSTYGMLVPMLGSQAALTYGWFKGSTQTRYLIRLDINISVDRIPMGVGDIIYYLTQGTDLWTKNLIAVDSALNADPFLVPGYTIGAVMSVKDAVDTLRKAFPFKSVDHDGMLKFTPLDSTSLLTINTTDMVVEGTEDPLQTELVLEKDMPSEVTVVYKRNDGDYQPAAQYARRHTLPTQNPMKVELPMVLDDVQASKIAERLLFEAWARRITHRFSVSQKHFALEAGDPFTIKKNNQEYVVRAINVTGYPRGKMDVQAVSESFTLSASYLNSTVVQLPGGGLISGGGSTGAGTGGGSGDPGFPGQQIPDPIIPVVSLLDIPLLQPYDDGVGFYAAAGPDRSGSWEGVYLDVSYDDGVTWQLIALLQTPAVIGTTLTQLLPGPIGPMDTANVLMVRLNTIGEIDSNTYKDLIQGFGYALVGDEIIQWRDAEQINSNTYVLRNLERGRKGTEFAVGVVDVTPTVAQALPPVTNPTGTTSTETNTTPPGTDVPVGQPTGLWVMTFKEEFDQGFLDSSKWTAAVYSGQSDGGVLNYEVSGGALRVWPLRNPSSAWYNRQFHTLGKFAQKYGFFEVRFRAHKGAGVPRVKLLADHQFVNNQVAEGSNPRLHAVEMYSLIDSTWGSGSGVNTIPTTAQAQLITPADVNVSLSSTTYGPIKSAQDAGDFATDYHVIGVLWDTTGFTLYLDGVPFDSGPNGMDQNAATVSGVGTGKISKDMEWALLSFGIELCMASGGGVPSPQLPVTGNFTEGIANAFCIDYVRAWKKV